MESDLEQLWAWESGLEELWAWETNLDLLWTWESDLENSGPGRATWNALGLGE